MADDPKTPPASGEDDPKDPPADLGDAGKKAIDEERKARREAERRANDLDKRLKEFEDAGKTEIEKLTGRVADLEPKLTAAEARALRLEIALDKGVPKSLAVRLQGSTREEMEADADELLKTIGNGKKTPSFDGGAKADDAPKGGSFLAQALRERR